MNPQEPKRRVPPIPVLVAATAVLMVCAGAVFALVNLTPWEFWLGKPEARVASCVIDEHKVPFPTEAGFARVTIEVTNFSTQDSVYVVGVAVKSAAGEVVGTAEHRIGVPAGHYREETWRVTLTKPGGRDCGITTLRED